MRMGRTITRKKLQRIDLHKISDVFRGLTNDKDFHNNLYSKIQLKKDGIETARFYIHNEGEKLLVRNTLSREQFETDFPFYDFEQFRQDMERIGIELRYISDEED